jgi:hypothetical protein
VTPRTCRNRCTRDHPNAADSLAFRHLTTYLARYRSSSSALSGARRARAIAIRNVALHARRTAFTPPKKICSVNEKNFRCASKSRVGDVAAMRPRIAMLRRNGRGECMQAQRRSPLSAPGCDRRHRCSFGPSADTPSSPTVSRIACSAPSISRTPRRPIQPTRKLGATVSLPG